jgi:hypothetical protein
VSIDEAGAKKSRWYVTEFNLSSVFTHICIVDELEINIIKYE